MHKLLTTALEHRAMQVTSARALAVMPGSHRLLRWVKPPAQDAFIAFLDALRSADPGALTRCAGWTVHELTAHLAAGSAEIADLIELELSAAPRRATRDFEEREAPFRALNAGRLQRAFLEEALRATVAVEQLLAAGDDQRVAFTGVELDARALVLHIESELVLHRWDIVGSDHTSITALSDSRFAIHAATKVASMTPNVFPWRVGDDTTIVLHAPGSRDIAVTGGTPTAINVAPQDHSLPVVQCHPAARTLLLWGRSPGPELPALAGAPSDIRAVVDMLRPGAA